MVYQKENVAFQQEKFVELSLKDLDPISISEIQ